jgi:hypothetical protein
VDLREFLVNGRFVSTGGYRCYGRRIISEYREVGYLGRFVPLMGRKKCLKLDKSDNLEGLRFQKV